jgi:DNA-binding transcriptional LysR family regulator
MTIRHLRILAAVCEYGSITVAAEKLYMTQPAVSLAIKELEEHYGVKLFDRLTRRIQITEDGRRMLDYAIHVVALFDEMEQAMKNPDVVGEVKIGSSLTIGACLLPEYVERLAKQHPALKPRVVIDITERIVHLVRDGRLDVGLVEGTVDDPSLIVLPFMEDKLIAVCGRSHPFSDGKPVDMDTFLAQPLLLRERGSGTRELFQSAVTLTGREVDAAWESVSTTALIRAVEAGNGVSVLPEKLVAEHLGTRLAQVNLESPSLSRSFYLIHHKNKYLSKGLLSLMDIVKSTDIPRHKMIMDS